MAKKKVTQHRMVPPEFVHVPHEKTALAARIAAQRTRLMTSAPRQHEDADALPAQTLATESSSNVFPRSKTMRALIKNPSLAACAGLAVLLLPLLLRRGGYKRVWRWAGVISPLVLNWLEKKHQKKHPPAP